MIDAFFGFFGVTPWQGLLILIVPIVVDYFRSLIKCAVVLLGKAIKKIKRAKPMVEYPSISIIVPAYNEGARITRTIETLLETRYPGEKEIIIVDDGSTDDTYFKALPYAKSGDIMLFKREGGGSRARAVNYGVPFAKGEVVVAFDADTQLEVESLKYLIEPFVDERVQAVSGNVRISNTRSLLAKLQALEYFVSMEVGKFNQEILRIIMVVPGAFGAFRRKFFEQVGRYDRDALTEDFCATLKIHKAGQVVFAPKALAWTNCPETWGGWIRQRTRWSRGQIETLWKHRNMFFKPRFGRVGMVGAPDMVFMDVVLLGPRIIWLILLLAVFPFWIEPAFSLNYYDYLIRVLSMTAILYVFFELVVFLTAVTVTPRKKEFKYIFLVPLVSLIYRPLFSLVRLKGYLQALLKTETKW